MTGSPRYFELKTGEWLARPEVILDTVGLTPDQREEGSLLMGGPDAEWITRDTFVNRMHEVTHLVIRWGNPQLPFWLAQMYEHGAPVHTEDPLLDTRTVPVSAVIDDKVYMLDMQPDPEELREIQRHYPDRFMDVDWHGPRARKQLAEHDRMRVPRPEVLVAYHSYLFALGLSVSIR